MTSPDGKAEGSYAFPLTFAQMRLWFLEQLEPGTTTYLIPWFIHVRGNLNVEALHASLNRLVARHEVLRTTFRANGGEPVQVVAPTLDIPLPLVDISGAPTPYREAQRHWSEEKQIPLDLPTDRPRPAMQTFRGAEKRVALPKNLTEKLNWLGRREGVTLFLTLLAAFQVLLARYSSQEDIVVGTPVANRNRAEIEGLIGFFANTLVLRTNLAGNPSFRELLGRVKETALSAYA